MEGCPTISLLGGPSVQRSLPAVKTGVRPVTMVTGGVVEGGAGGDEAMERSEAGGVAQARGGAGEGISRSCPQFHITLVRLRVFCTNCARVLVDTSCDCLVISSIKHGMCSLD